MFASADPPRHRWALRWTPPDSLPVVAFVLGRGISSSGAHVNAEPAETPLTPGGAAGRLSLGIARAPQGPVARLGQVHSDRVVAVAGPGTSAATDAAVTTTPGLWLSVRTADCVPVVLASPAGVAVAHAGWRGSAEGIAALTLRKLLEATGDSPAVCAAWIGPAIGPCCYEVGPDVARRFPGACLSGNGGVARLDLALANRRQLEEAGLDPERILDSGICTRCHQHLFHSHRGSGGKKGRIDAVVSLPRRAQADPRSSSVRA